MEDGYPKLFGTSGIRKKVSSFPENFAENLGKALGTYSKNKKIAVGRDTRKSSPQLEGEFIKGLLSTGHDAIKLGVVPTPTLAMAAQNYGTGVIITASHNPPEYNGFKFWNKGGAFLPEKEEKIERIFYEKNFKEKAKGKVREEDYLQKHLSLVFKKLGKVKGEVKIFLDCANGSGSTLTPKLLEKMGCEVKAINTELKGNFPHPLEPTEENLKEICREVKNSSVDLGLVHDGDADRTAAISRDGNLIKWDSFLALLAFGKKKIVTTVDASMRIEEVCKRVVRVPVGDVAVANAVYREKAQFGGEPSGSFIFPEFHLFPDGPLTAAVAAKLISQKKFYSRLKKIPSYPTQRLKIPCKEKAKKKIMTKVMNIHDFKDVNYADGLRVSFKDSWFLIRPSGTESIIRITAEGRNEKALEKTVAQAKKLLQNCL